MKTTGMITRQITRRIMLISMLILFISYTTGLYDKELSYKNLLKSPEVPFLPSTIVEEELKFV